MIGLAGTTAAALTVRVTEPSLILGIASQLMIRSRRLSPSNCPHRAPIIEHMNKLTEAEFTKERADLLDVLLDVFGTRGLRVNRSQDIRIRKDFARELLLRNEKFIINGTVNWLDLKRLGLGVYGVTLNDEKVTRLV